MSDAEWEALCDGCGKCCELRPTGFACPGLDVETRRCRVYEKRLTTHPCIKVKPDNVMHLHGLGILPDTCGYVRHAQGKPPLDYVPEYPLLPYEKAPEGLKRHFEGFQRGWFKKPVTARDV